MLRVLAFTAAAILLLPSGAALSAPLPSSGIVAAAGELDRAEFIQTKTKRAKAKAPRRARRVGSSGTVNLTPIQPNAPVGPDLSIPRAAPSIPTPLAAPQPQSPYVTPGGAFPVPSRRPSDTFQDRASRCQHAAGVYGVPEASRGGYVHNCAM